MFECTTLTGYRIKGRTGFGHWAPLLEEWSLGMERFCRMMMGEDAPYIYTERANIGVLAGAAWRCGWVALEEFQHFKGYQNKPKSRGRADLYLASEKTDEMLEAKQKRVCLTTKETNQLRQANDLLKKAMIDAKKTNGGDRSIDCVASAFLGMWLNSKRRKELTSAIESTIVSFRKSAFPVVAWSFPKEVRQLESSKGYLLPGVIMIASKK